MVRSHRRVSVGASRGPDLGRDNVSLNDYMMKIVDMNEVSFTYLYRYILNFKVCGLMKSLLRIYWVIGLHMFISLLDKDWGHQQGIIMMDEKRSRNIYKLK